MQRVAVVDTHRPSSRRAPQLPFAGRRLRKAALFMGRLQPSKDRYMLPVDCVKTHDRLKDFYFEVDSICEEVGGSGNTVSRGSIVQIRTDHGERSRRCAGWRIKVR